MSTLLLVARQELVLAARARSIQIFAAVFGVLALTVAGSGYVLTGGVGVQDFARTAHADLLKAINADPKLTPEFEQGLKKVCEEFAQTGSY